jgi:hypothetical protein
VGQRGTRWDIEDFELWSWVGHRGSPLKGSPCPADPGFLELSRLADAE